MSTTTAESRFDEFFDRAWRRSRTSMRTRVNRVKSKAWHIGQCAVAATIAWFIASDLVHHQAPVFAPIVAVVSLGLTYAQRLRRVAEITVGVAIGLAVADLFLALFGTGPLQIGVIVVCAMTTALLLDPGGLLVMQATVQSIFVVALVATPGAAVNRWFDAVIGGAVALVAAAVVPAAPLRQPRTQAAIVVETIADLLRDAAQCTRDGDIARAAKVLGEARATDGPLRELQAAASEGLSVIASSPFRRGERESVRSVADLVDPLDRAIRSTRVLVRRAALTATKHIRVPRSYAVVLDDLADAVGIVARVLGENASASMGRGGIVAVGQATADLERGLLSTDVLLAQIRSVVVDMLQVTGMTYEEAVAAIPTLPERLVDE
ncbi:FUSC family protein [Lapillicoccus sp.]|uniref:FUSC family protein n=1 Tax=Lapillicoccus sp. TaxID=1909287 RepID=UPI003264F0A9